MSKRNLYIPAAILVALLLMSGLFIGGQPTSQAQTADEPSGTKKASQELPEILKDMPEDMKVNHGKYDNRLTALYEQWLAGEDILSGSKSGISSPNPAFSPLYGPDVDMSTLTTTENEYQITINPLNSQFAVGGSNDGMTAGVGLYNTSDSGATWRSVDASVYGVPAACCDPAVAYGPDGTVYAGVLDTSPRGQYTLRSTDNGATFVNLGLLPLADRNQIATDPSNPNILYTFYFDASGSGQIEGYKSTDRGTTWGPAFTVSDPPPPSGYQQSPAADVASNGWVYVGYQEYINSSQGCNAGVRNGIARSTDGGATWAQTEFSIIQGGACPPSQVGRGVFCVNAGGSSFRSRSHPIVAVHPTNPMIVYVTYTGGDFELPYTCGTATGFHSDMLFRKSTDGGVTFSAATKINDDPQGKDQYYGWIDAAPNGTLWAGWHDRREDVNNFQHKWYQSYSIDEGATWRKLDGAVGNDAVADVPSQPSTFIGDYNGIAATNDLVLGMWWDSRADPYTDPQVPPAQGTPTPTVTGTPPTATRTSTSLPSTNTPTITPTPCQPSTVSGSLDAADPDFTRPNTFLQGGTCTTNGVHNYDVYEYYMNTAGTVTASTCGGASWDTYLVLYQAPGGVRRQPYVPNGCTEALAANDDVCGLQSTVSATIQPGYFYLVVSEFSTPGGAYTVSVTGVTGCQPVGTPGTSTTTPTRTATSVPGSPTATCPPGTPGGTSTPIVVNGSITSADPTQVGRLNRFPTVVPCGASRPCPGTFTTSGNRNYDEYTYTNTGSTTACITVDLNTACTGTQFIFSAAYLTTFNPTSLCQNYLDDSTASPNPTVSYDFDVPAGATFKIIVHEVAPASGCASYTMTVTGLPGGGGGGCPTPTAGTPVVTCTPSAGGAWSAGPNHPATGIVRAVGVYFPANQKFYTMGGRTSDAAGSDLANPFRFTPGSPGTWVMKSAVFPDNQVNNMACGVLTDAGTPYIYCVGGSAAGAATATARVFRYNPVTNVLTPIAAPWPGNTTGDTLPGGFAVVNNKLYIIGGFKINVAMTNQTWEFTPGTNAWVAKANLPVERGYVPATTIGSMIYTGGGTAYVGGLLEDTTESFRYDPATNTYTAIAPLPRATGETRAVTLNGEMWVLGGGRVDPNPSNQVDIYNPGSNSWRVGTPFSTARRNFPADSNGTDRIWLVGGYAPTTATNTMEIYTGSTGGGCTPGPTNTVGATSTATRTGTAVPPTSTRTSTAVPPTSTRTSTSVSGTATRTNTPQVACNIEFTDVPLNNPFRIYIRCLACRGIVSGYSDGTFRPFNDVTRGQAAKMISNSAGFSENHTTVRYTDVPTTHTFYQFIMRLTTRNIATGYNDPVNCAGVGIPCFKPQASITRGQLAKMDSNAAGFDEPIPAGSQAFTDVPPTHTFYVFIQRLSRRGIISGYECGRLPAGPCDALRRPYYLPQNNVTRGQTAKIVANTFFPECQQPGPETTPPARPVDGQEGGPANY